MRTIVAGSRDIKDFGFVQRTLDRHVPRITTLISGGCRGVDALAEQWAKMHGIPIERYEALWDKYGKLAGPIRNERMAVYGDALVAIRSSKGSKGTNDMIERAKEHGLIVTVVDVMR